MTTAEIKPALCKLAVELGFRSPNETRPFLGFSSRAATTHFRLNWLTIRAPRGHGWGDNPIVIVEAHARRGQRGRIWSSAAIRLDVRRGDYAEKFSKWLAQVASPAHVALVATEASRAALKAERDAAQQKYVTALAGILGHGNGGSYQVFRGEDGLPAGVEISLRITGTPEQVARKWKLVCGIK